MAVGLGESRWRGKELAYILVSYMPLDNVGDERARQKRAP